MPLIHILPEHLRNVIAAGEVIERPASVVKELIENSIDAGAKDIKIEVLYGGKKLIRVSDDGCGMEREDALLSVERYATSKLSQIEDLTGLKTLGFRGEALASIASVSKLTIETGTDMERPATLIEIIGGQLKEVREAPPFKGTIVTVKDLFFNTPARRKFLRANSTELAHIMETVIYEALADPGRGYKLFADHTEVLFLPPAYEPGERVAQVFGMEVFEHMMEFEYSSEEEFTGWTLHAFISRPPEVRSKKTGQYLFINQRPVKDHIVSRAIYDGLGELVPKDRHPLFVVYLRLPPSMVDFNVHPAKKEVRFSDSASLYEFVKKAVARSVAKAAQKTHKDTSRAVSTTGEAEVMKITGEVVNSVIGEVELSSSSLHLFTHSTIEPFSYEKGFSFIPAGDVFVAISEPDGLLIMDIHAAHERVLYERFLKGSIQTKRLLFPAQVQLQPLYHRLLLEAQHLLRDLGFEIEDFGTNTVIVRTLPAPFKEEHIRPVLEDIGATLRESEETGSIKGLTTVTSPPGEETKRHLVARLACHKSVRAGEALTGPEIETLYRELLMTSEPYHCPHGRPTLIKITKEELYKRFGRV